MIHGSPVIKNPNGQIGNVPLITNSQGTVDYIGTPNIAGIWSFSAQGGYDYTAAGWQNLGVQWNVPETVKVTVNPAHVIIPITTIAPIAPTPTPAPTQVIPIKIISPGAVVTFTPQVVGTPTPTPSATPSASTGATQSPTQQPSAKPTPGQSDTVEGWSVDNVAPTTTLNLTGVTNAGGEFVSNVICTLTGQDNPDGSGLYLTQYSFDGNTWNNYTQPFTISTPGTTDLYYKSTDNSSNAEVAQVKAIIIAGATASPKSPAPSVIMIVLSIVAGAGIIRLARKR